MVIVDEAHRASEAVNGWMADPQMARVPFVGLSATPWTRGLGKYYDDFIVAARTGDLIAAGFLSRFIVYAPSVPDLTDVKTVAGDFHEGQLAEAVNKAEIVGDVISTWMERAENRPTLVYAVDRQHARHLCERFLEAGIAAEYVDAFTEREDRERIFRRFRTGETRVICNVATLTVGLDLDVRCIVDARPTKSEMQFVQTIGRGLRTAPSKDHLIVLDHSGNHLRLGLVTDIHHDRLDDGEHRRSNADQERAARLPRRCDDCTAIIPHGAESCPQCGAQRHAKSAVRTVEGRLVELGSGKSSRIEPTISEQAEFLSELRGLARERRYADGWPSHKFKERFGVWPNDQRIRHAPAKAPTLRTKQWVLSRTIAHAKARRNG
jgi:superfamily II DNA or RNA helicase